LQEKKRRENQENMLINFKKRERIGTQSESKANDTKGNFTKKENKQTER